jgi:hypothetical protein
MLPLGSSEKVISTVKSLTVSEYAVLNGVFDSLARKDKPIN